MTSWAVTLDRELRQCSESGGSLPKVTRLVNEGATVWTQVCCSAVPQHPAQFTPWWLRTCYRYKCLAWSHLVQRAAGILHRTLAPLLWRLNISNMSNPQGSSFSVTSSRISDLFILWERANFLRWYLYLKLGKNVKLKYCNSEYAIRLGETQLLQWERGTILKN